LSCFFPFAVGAHIVGGKGRSMYTSRGTGGGLFGSNHVSASNELTVAQVADESVCRYVRVACQQFAGVSGIAWMHVGDVLARQTHDSIALQLTCVRTETTTRPTFLPESGP
jgi:hypothetical protein